MASVQRPEVLIIDDQPANLDVLRRLLERDGYSLSIAANGPRGIEVARATTPDIILLDVVMPGMDGYEVCRRLKAEPRTAGIPVIFITARDEETDLLDGFTAGGVDYIPKPIREYEVLARVRTHVRQAQLVQELEGANQELRDEIEQRQRLKGQLTLISEREEAHWGVDGFLGNSDTVRAILQDVRLLQETGRTSVLITGESGTGKELIARAVHAGGRRRGGPFLPVNCAAIPGQLGESLLFGHVRGAFTGATADRPGYFEMAHGGSLFLDEIGDMPLEMQAKLLRVLEDGEVWRVGERRARQVDVRVIAATNADLPQRIEAGLFRQDLFYRIAAYTVEVPPLRERRNDILLLVHHFLRLFAEEMGVAEPVLGEQARQQLQVHEFRGNVRELKNVIERAVLESRGGIIEARHLHLAASAPTAAGAAGKPASSVGEPQSPSLVPEALPGSLDAGVADAALRIVENAVRAAEGNVTEAARLLGTSRTRLYRILRSRA
jgi:DNA-binding NtrC family response regulator